MRGLPAGLLALLFALACVRPAYAQQGSVQMTSATQVVAAEPARRAGQPLVDPDLGFSIHQPGAHVGSFFLDLHAVRRTDRLHLGQASVGLRDVKLAGMLWTFTAGDTSVAPTVSAFNFGNLFAPQVAFAGGSVSGFGSHGSITSTAGRVTALRNIFGSDPQTLGQDLAQVQARLKPGGRAGRVEWLARASGVRTTDVREFGYSIQSGDDAGVGARVRVTPTLELSADAGMSWFQRRGSPVREQSPTGLVGGRWTIRRGWLQVNAHRFAPGYFAVLNSPYLDREGVYGAGEYEFGTRLRVFGGIEAFRTNVDPEASVAADRALPRGLSQRAYAGTRLHLGGRSFLTVRYEDGDRTARPVQRPGALVDSDTGVLSVDLRHATKRVSSYTRYERRENIDHANQTGTYTQHTGTAQVFTRLTPRANLFVNGLLTQRQNGHGGGQTFLQGGGGIQMQLPRRQLWFRSEGLFSLTDDWATDQAHPHELFTVGLSGQLTPRTALAFDVTLDRTPQPAGGNPWLGRSMIRVMHNIPTGSARVNGAASARPAGRRRGQGHLLGVAFVDWNGNGLQDPGEDALAGVPFAYADTAYEGAAAPRVVVTSGQDGQFAFVNVPLGRAVVALDLVSLPVDYDPPAQTSRETEVRERGGERLAFGLVPLGSVAGTVMQDSTGDGRGDSPIDGAVLILDGGERSEQTRAGAFRFDAVRSGPHTVQLLLESLPQGASLAGDPVRELTLERDRLHAELAFVVRLEKRPEIRKVFPPIQGAGSPQTAPRAATPPRSAAAPRARTSPAPQRAPAARPAPSTPAGFAVQLAALSDRARASALVDALQADGLAAYLVEEGDGLAKVRVGRYRTRLEARRQLDRLQAFHHGDAWIARTALGTGR